MKALLALIFIFVSTVAWGQTWHTANQATVGWDAVTTLENGNPVSPNEVSYTVYLYNAVTDPDHLNPVEVGSTQDTEYLITLAVEGRYFFGVKSVRTVNSEKVSKSAITWSSLSEYDFGLQFYLAPSEPKGLIKK